MITSRQDFAFGSFTAVGVDPAGSRVRVEWKGYNVQTGGAFRPPYEVMVLTSGDEKYVVSDRGIGNEGLVVDGERIEFANDSEHVVIRFGDGVSVQAGSVWEGAHSLYSLDFANLEPRGR